MKHDQLARIFILVQILIVMLAGELYFIPLIAFVGVVIGASIPQVEGLRRREWLWMLFGLAATLFAVRFVINSEMMDTDWFDPQPVSNTMTMVLSVTKDEDVAKRAKVLLARTK